jgi:DNA-binding HxlR family transcriptional regulator
MRKTRRSGCPINLAVELLGDRWSFVVLRDVMFADWHTYAELFSRSEEGIASNILVDRLARLTAAGILRRSPVPGHRQKVRWDLTEAGIDLLPVLGALGAWGSRHLDADPELAAMSLALEASGPQGHAAFKARLRAANELPGMRAD